MDIAPRRVHPPALWNRRLFSTRRNRSEIRTLYVGHSRQTSQHLNAPISIQLAHHPFRQSLQFVPAAFVTRSTCRSRVHAAHLCICAFESWAIDGGLGWTIRARSGHHGVRAQSEGLATKRSCGFSVPSQRDLHLYRRHHFARMGDQPKGEPGRL